MMDRRQCLAGALAALCGLPAWAETALDGGKGPVRIVSTLPAGSGPDVVARLVAEKLQARWDRAVVVDPRPGGAGSVAINAMKGAPPNGANLVVVDVGQLSINPLIFRRLSYDPDKDLVPVAILYQTAFFVAVAADSPYRSLRDLFAQSGRTQPLRYGSNGVGTPIHLASARLEHAIGTPMLHVPYKETAQMYAAVSTGELDWAYGSVATTAPLVQAGKLRLLAVADRQRFAAVPDVPTLEEALGLKDLDALSWVALMASRGTPARVADEINAAVNVALASPDVRERMAGFGFVPGNGPARQVTEWMQADRRRYAEVLKRVKVQVD